MFVPWCTVFMEWSSIGNEDIIKGAAGERRVVVSFINRLDAWRIWSTPHWNVTAACCSCYLFTPILASLHFRASIAFSRLTNYPSKSRTDTDNSKYIDISITLLTSLRTTTTLHSPPQPRHIPTKPLLLLLIPAPMFLERVQRHVHDVVQDVALAAVLDALD